MDQQIEAARGADGDFTLGEQETLDACSEAICQTEGGGADGVIWHGDNLTLDELLFLRDAVLEVCAKAAQITPADILGYAKERPIAEARALAYYYCFTHRGYSAPLCALMFGRQHTTIILTSRRVTEVKHLNDILPKMLPLIDAHLDRKLAAHGKKLSGRTSLDYTSRSRHHVPARVQVRPR